MICVEGWAEDPCKMAVVREICEQDALRKDGKDATMKLELHFKKGRGLTAVSKHIANLVE